MITQTISRNERRQTAAFTLIEILVAVAIIAILAAIAVPNMLSAQTRSKVARAKSDLRVLAGALESYAVDHGLPPLDYNVSRGDPIMPGMIGTTSGILHPGYQLDGGVKPGLTTPVAYIANCWMNDPFVVGASIVDVPFDEQKYTYNWFAPNPLRGIPVREQYSFQEYEKHYGNWRLGSVGPDRDFYNGDAEQNLYSASRVYDPTNGTVSVGNIWRSHASADATVRPPFDEVVAP